MIEYGEKYAAMTFEQIAKRLNVTRAAVRMSYVNGMRKIRNDREAMERLRGLMEERDRGKQERIYPEWI